MKQFFCVLVTLLASAALLFLVSAPVNSVHEEEHEETSQHAAAETEGHVLEEE